MVAFSILQCLNLLMEPKDVETLRRLREAATLAQTAVKDFEEREIYLGNEEENTLSKEGFGILWKSLLPMLDTSVTFREGEEVAGMTHYRYVMVEGNVYGLVFLLNSRSRSERYIRAEWHYYGDISTLDDNNHFTWSEHLAENMFDVAYQEEHAKRTLEYLRASFSAYEDAQPVSS